MMSELGLRAMSALPHSPLHRLHNPHSAQPHTHHLHAQQPHSPNSPLPTPTPTEHHPHPPSSDELQLKAKALSHGLNDLPVPSPSLSMSPSPQPASLSSSTASSPASTASSDSQLSTVPPSSPTPSDPSQPSPDALPSSDPTDHPPSTSPATSPALSAVTSTPPISPLPSTDLLTSPVDAASTQKRRGLTVEIPSPSPRPSPATSTSSLPHPPQPSSPSSRHLVWMTPAQAKVESKKLKGYRWVPIAPPALSAPDRPRLVQGVVAGRSMEEKRQRKEKRWLEDEMQEAETVSRGGGATPGSRRASASSSSSPYKGGAASPAYPSYGQPGTPRTSVQPRKLKRQAPSPELMEAPTNDTMRALELRLQALQAREAMLLAAAQSSPAPPAAAKKRKSAPAPSPSTFAAPETKKSRPAPSDFTVPASPAASPPSYYTSYGPTTPSAAGSSPMMTKKGRSIRTPTHFVSAEPVVLSTDLRRCKTLLDHLTLNKAAQGVFNAPVNYSDPSKPYFAAGYLDTIQGPPMDLGTIKSNLTNGHYDTVDEFAADVRLVWRNAQLFNPADDWIHKIATEMGADFETALSKIRDMAEREAERKAKRAQERADKLAAISAGAATPSDSASVYDFQAAAPPSSLSEVALQRSSTGPPTRPKARPSISPSISHLPASRLSSTTSSSTFSSAPRPLAQREKQMLKDDIFKLPPHKLGPVVEIISRSNANVANADDDEIEIDIDKLDVPTLRELQEYVKRALAPPPKRPGVKAAAPSASARSPSQTTTPRHLPSGSILQSPPRMQTPDREAVQGVPQSPSAQSLGDAKGEGEKARYESDDSSDDSDDEAADGKKTAPPTAFPMTDDAEV